MKFLTPLTFAILLLASCNDSESSNSLVQDRSDSVELISIEGSIDEDGSYRSDKGQFIVRFPLGEVRYENEEVNSEVGKVHYHTFVVADPNTQDYMVSVSYYPDAHVKAKGGAQMLTDAFGGIAKGLDAYKIDHNDDFTLNDLPGKRFRVHGSEWYVQGELLMIDKRLYQKLILKKGAYSDSAQAKAFFDSFHLLGK